MIRVGAIKYCNPRPIDRFFLNNPPSDVVTHIDVPSSLNELMAEEKLDISPISLAHYAENSEAYILLPDLVIAAEKHVKSVLMFHNADFKNIRKVGFNGEGKTTPTLCRLLFSMNGWAQPQFVQADSPDELLKDKTSGYLSIGDEALFLSRPDSGICASKISDLAEFWNSITGTPTVFAVWAVRAGFYEEDPGAVASVYRQLAESKAVSSSEISEIASEESGKTGLPAVEIERYLNNLSFDFNEKTIAGAECFAAQCFKYELIKSPATFRFVERPALVVGDSR